MQQQPPPQGPQKVKLGELIKRVVDHTNEELTQIVRRRVGSDAQRREAILAWTKNAHRRFMHLYVLQKWSAAGLETVEKCEQLETFLADQKNKLSECLDSFYFMKAGGCGKKGLYAMRERQWDIPTAVDVLADREVSRLPRSVANAWFQPPMEAWDREYTIRRVDDAIRFRLLDTQAVRHNIEGV